MTSWCALEFLRRCFTAIFLLLSLLAGGCGYSLGFVPVGGARTVAVPVLDNQTDRVDLELPLTRAIRREILTRTPLRLAGIESADLLLTGTLRAVLQTVQAEDTGNTAEFATATIVADFDLVDLRNGRKLRTRQTRIEMVEYDPRFDSPEQLAEDEAFLALAERVILLLDAGWESQGDP